MWQIRRKRNFKYVFQLFIPASKFSARALAEPVIISVTTEQEIENESAVKEEHLHSTIVLPNSKSGTEWVRTPIWGSSFDFPLLLLTALWLWPKHSVIYKEVGLPLTDFQDKSLQAQQLPSSLLPSPPSLSHKSTRFTLLHHLPGSRSLAIPIFKPCTLLPT